MYRACTWLKLYHGFSYDELIAMLACVEFIFLKQGQVLTLKYNFNGARVEDVTKAIRTPEVTSLVSDVSANEKIRAIMTHKQQEIAANTDVVMDGRDIGTVVLPNAELKFFLTASPEERAMRRTREWNGVGLKENYETVLKEIIERDRKDASRAVSPLKKSDDAKEIDTTVLTINQVAGIISAAVDDFIASIGGE
jgi:cytidylate kinase